MFIDRIFATNEHKVINEHMEKPGIACFEVNNVAQYIKNKNQDKFDIPVIRPPFELCWFEWLTPKFHTHMWESGADNKPIKDFDVTLKTEGNLIYSVKENSGLISLVTFTFSEDILGNIYPGGAQGIVQINEMGKPIMMDNYHGGMLANALSPEVAMSLGFLNCKNVLVEKTIIPNKLQISRQKKGKQPLITFHTLNIRPMVRLLRELGQSETKGLKYALHICRGHFKDFSKSGGLFGKYKGLYWWDAQVRGKISEGIVLKDYKISAEKE
jgi:hypothetical protein